MLSGHGVTLEAPALHEEPQHLTGCIKARRVGVVSLRMTARPGMSSTVDLRVFGDAVAVCIVVAGLPVGSLPFRNAGDSDKHEIAPRVWLERVFTFRINGFRIFRDVFPCLQSGIRVEDGQATSKKQTNPDSGDYFVAVSLLLPTQALAPYPASDGLV